MADEALEARLKCLGEIFGEECTLVEPPKPEHSVQETLNTDENQAGEDVEKDAVPLAMQSQQSSDDVHLVKEDIPGQEARNAKSATAAEQKKDDAPRKFLNHDTGPRASTEAAFDNSMYKIGQPPEKIIEFCPWKVVSYYPNHYVGKTNRPHVTPYFDDILKERTWDFFYMYHPQTVEDKPILFVPTAQLQVFLDHINVELSIALSIPGGVNSDRFFMRFGSDDTPSPRYLKRALHPTDLEIDEWPDVHPEDIDAFKKATSSAQQALTKQLSLCSMAPKKNSKQKKIDKGAEKRADRQHMLEETQALLGLGQQTAAHGGNNGRDAVFISIDVEAIELPPNPVSEVGIAILDSRDIRHVPRGPCGTEWWKYFKCFHLRTREYSGLVNHRFIQGCPDAFDFGTSTFPARDELPGAIKSIICPYIEASRELVLVGHDAKQDMQYLADIGVDLIGMRCISRVLDSQAIHLSWSNSTNGRSLQQVLVDLGLWGKNFHNAGNDAVYTLRALIGVAIEAQRKTEAELASTEAYVPELVTAFE